MLSLQNTPEEKSCVLREQNPTQVGQINQLKNPDARLCLSKVILMLRFWLNMLSVTKVSEPVIEVDSLSHFGKSWISLMIGNLFEAVQFR